MRFLLSLIVIALAACGGPPQDKTETAADDAQESINSSLEKAEAVEDVLQDAADSRDAAIEESTDNN
ncbi:MAG: hypothetical protein ACR2QL_01115 [Woeseiaceae bacterium]